MWLRINNLRLPVEAPEAELPARIARRLGLRADDLGAWRILRKSLDARAREDLRFVYSVAVETPARDWAPSPGDADVDRYLAESFDDPSPGERPLESRPVVIGSGPAGLAAAYYL